MKIIALGLAGIIAAAAVQPADAASLSFNLKTAPAFAGDTDYSSVSVISNSRICAFGSCALSAALATPLPSFTLEEGAPAYEFDFANFFVSSGIGGDSDARVEALLAFTTPEATSVGTAGTGNYLRVGGWFRPGALVGSLDWDVNSHDVIADDGSTFTVTFQDIAGFTASGRATSRVSIFVSDVAAPMPEPATWGMLILGFGLVGGAMRRRRATTLATA